MNQTTKKIIIILGVIIIAFGIYFFSRNRSSVVSDIATTTPYTATTTQHTIGGITVTGPAGSYTISQMSSDSSSQPVPNLTGPVVFGTVSLTPEVKVIVTQKITDLRSVLSKDSKNISAWINLGIYQKMAGDYQGAVTSWKYVTKISSNDFVSRGNLGDLYAYYVHDNAQAEMYYKEAIKIGPTQEYLYSQFALMYRDVFKDIEKALYVVDEGLKKIPDSTVLLELNTQLKK